jgi:membrane protein YqaA with SNARE-associated domain
MSLLATCLGLFLSALMSATLFPGQSEALLAALVVGSSHPWLLVVVASIGNTLGSVVNWVLGRGIERFRNRKWFPVSQAALDRAQYWYQRYGKWSLLLSWAPVIGDPLTLVAGVLREPLPVFVALVAIAKTLRYVVVTAVAMQLLA